MICFTIIVTFITSTANANKNKQLHAWYEKITDQKFNCPAPAESELNPGNGQPILKVVDCDDPSATYRYDYKVNIQGVPSIGTHFRFQFLTFLIVLSKKCNSAI